MGRLSLIILFIFSLVACKKQTNQFQVEGNIDNWKNDTILIYGLEKDSTKIDTIAVVNGKFSFSSNVDTLTSFMMIFPGLEEYLIYADKGLKVSIEGDSASLDKLQIRGGDLNDKLNEFRSAISDIQDKDIIISKADTFIRTNPYSRVSIYLLDKYFVSQENPDIDKIQSLISSMSGELQDNLFVKSLTDPLKKQTEMAIGKRISSLSFKKLNGDVISLNSPELRDKYVFLNFWASWSKPSMEENEMIKRIRKKFKKNNKEFEFIGVSLDTDKKVWEEIIKRDTLNWEQVTDLNGWENASVKHYGIEKLPSNVLIDKRKNIVAKDLKEEELITKLEEYLRLVSP